MQSADIEILIYFLYLLSLCSNYPQKSSLLVLSGVKERLHFMAQKWFTDKKFVPSTRPVRLCALCDRVFCDSGQIWYFDYNEYVQYKIYLFIWMHTYILMHFNLITILYMMKYLRVLCIKYTIDKTFMAISNMLSFMHYFVKSVLWKILYANQTWFVFWYIIIHCQIKNGDRS